MDNALRGNCEDDEHNHFADGWLCSSEGRPISRFCRASAERIMAEFREKLGEDWSFRPYDDV
jgi:hypothetical protein